MESTGKKKKSSASSTVLAPGFRFHPTDEELVRYYLRRKVCGKAFLMDAISDIDIYKVEPWDLPILRDDNRYRCVKCQWNWNNSLCEVLHDCDGEPWDQVTNSTRIERDLEL